MLDDDRRHEGDDSKVGDPFILLLLLLFPSECGCEGMKSGEDRLDDEVDDALLLLVLLLLSCRRTLLLLLLLFGKISGIDWFTDSLLLPLPLLPLFS